VNDVIPVSPWSRVSGLGKAVLPSACSLRFTKGQGEPLVID
jgi:hypothetical protein